jgi:hypothetical protein
MANKQRLEELAKDERFCHPEDVSRKTYIDKEKAVCVQKDVFLMYLNDKWNWFDLIFIALLLVVIATHVADVLDHNERIARIHIQIFSVAIVFIGVRVFEAGKTINMVTSVG